MYTFNVQAPFFSQFFNLWVVIYFFIFLFFFEKRVVNFLISISNTTFLTNILIIYIERERESKTHRKMIFHSLLQDKFNLYSQVNIQLHLCITKVSQLTK